MLFRVSCFFLDRLSLTSSAFHSARFPSTPRCFYIAPLFYDPLSEDGIRFSIFTRQREGKQRRRSPLLSDYLVRLTAREAKKRKAVRRIEMRERMHHPTGENKAFRTVVGHNFRSFRDRISWRQCVLGTAIPDATDSENTAGITVP